MLSDPVLTPIGERQSLAYRDFSHLYVELLTLMEIILNFTQLLPSLTSSVQIGPHCFHSPKISACLVVQCSGASDVISLVASGVST